MCSLVPTAHKAGSQPHRHWDPATPTCDAGTWEQVWNAVLGAGMVRPHGRALPLCNGCATGAPLGAKMLGFLPSSLSLKHGPKWVLRADQGGLHVRVLEGNSALVQANLGCNGPV